MKNDFSICIVGLGSIGRRHARNALALDARVFALRTGRAHPDVPAGDLAFDEIYELQDAIRRKPDLAIIATPTHLHCETAIRFVEAGVPVLVEKPLSDRHTGLDQLEKAQKTSGARCFVGYMMRYDPGIEALSKLIETGGLGPIHTAYIEWNTYLPAWHPWEDYRESYAARSDMGGGVVLTCSHEIDLARHLFGECETVFALGGSKTTLGINAEDSVSALLSHCSGVTTHLNLGYAHKPGHRAIRVIGEDASAEWDFLTQRTTRTGPDGEDIVAHQSGATADINDTYLSELKSVIGAIECGGSIPIDFSNGRRTLDLCLAILESMRSGLPVHLPGKKETHD